MKKSRYFLLLIGLLSSCGSVGSSIGDSTNVSDIPTVEPTSNQTVEPTVGVSNNDVEIIS